MTFQENWFRSRNISIRGYQMSVIADMIKHISGDKIIVLAAAPNSGKTLLSICFIDWYLQTFGGKALVLAHATSILRTQFIHDIQSSSPDFTSSLIDIDTEFGEEQVAVSIPQSIARRNIPNFNLMVIDESHQHYTSYTVQKIIREISPQKTILLTGTPSIFLNDPRYVIIPIALEELVHGGYTHNVTIGLSGADYDFSMGDFNANDEITHKRFATITEDQTSATMEYVLGGINKKIASNDKTWLNAMIQLRKTMFVCKNITQATQTSDYLTSHGVNHVISTSYDDVDSTNVDIFKQDDKCLAMVVVNRGVLGFSFSDLWCVVDLSCSKNVNRIFQLLCRVVRKGKRAESKLFIKVVPQGLREYFRYVMSCVICLSKRKWFLQYTGGKTMDDVINVVDDEYKEEKRGKSEISGSMEETIHDEFDYTQLLDLNLLEKTVTNSMVYAKGSLEESLEKISSISTPEIKLDTLSIIKETNQYTNIADWKKKNFASYIHTKNNNKTLYNNILLSFKKKNPKGCVSLAQ